MELVGKQFGEGEEGKGESRETGECYESTKHATESMREERWGGGKGGVGEEVGGGEKRERRKGWNYF